MLGFMTGWSWYVLFNELLVAHLLGVLLSHMNI